jgi:hypothetical protein
MGTDEASHIATQNASQTVGAVERAKLLGRTTTLLSDIFAEEVPIVAAAAAAPETDQSDKKRRRIFLASDEEDEDSQEEVLKKKANKTTGEDDEMSVSSIDNQAAKSRRRSNARRLKAGNSKPKGRNKKKQISDEISDDDTIASNLSIRDFTEDRSSRPTGSKAPREGDNKIYIEKKVPLGLNDGKKFGVGELHYNPLPNTFRSAAQSQALAPTLKMLIRNNPEQIFTDMLDTEIDIENVPASLANNFRQNREYEIQERKFFRSKELDPDVIKKTIEERYADLMKEANTKIKDLKLAYRKTTSKKLKKKLREDFKFAVEDKINIEQSIENEKYLYHPDSLTCLRYHAKPVNEIYHFEAITATNIQGNKATNMYLTKKWVYNYFDEDFINQVMKMGKGQYIHLENPSANATQESFEIAQEYRNQLEVGEYGAKKRLTKKFRGGEGIMLIAQLRLTTKYKNLEPDPFERKWEITAIAKDCYLNTKTARKEVSDWLEIEESLVMHADCVGPDPCFELINELRTHRRGYLVDAIAPEQENEVTIDTYTSSVYDFIDMEDKPGTKRILQSAIKIDELHLVPHYILGEKQISSIRYDSKRDNFYGRTITGVYQSGKRFITSDELLPIEWVEDNLSYEFIQVLKAQKKEKFMYIPVGNSFFGKEYPYPYNKSYPQIAYMQGELNICATASLASVMNELQFHEAAEKIYFFGKRQAHDIRDGLIKIQILIRWIETNLSQITTNFQMRKMEEKTFDIFNDATPNNPKLIKLQGSDGSCSHALCIHNGKIYDSNLDYAVDLNKENLDFCCDAVFQMVFFGYEFCWREKNERKLSGHKKRRKKKKQLHESTKNE